MTTQAEFFQQHAVNGEIPDHLMAQMLALPEGDISLVVDVNAPTIKEGSDSPDAADPGAASATPAPAPAAAAPAPAPAEATPQVVLAKDGVHTIPFERLEEARTQAAENKRIADEATRRAAELEAENQRLKASATPSPAPAPATAAPAPSPDMEREGLFGDYSDTAIAAGVEKLIAQRTASFEQQIAALKQQLTPVQQAAELSANEAHWRTIYTAHPDTDSLVESAQLDAWIGKQPAFAQASYRAVLEQGTADQVVDLFNAYKDANGIARQPTAGAPALALAPAAAAAQAAAAAIAAAKTVPPTSLSEIPAGTSAHHDEAAAMLELTPTALMTKLENLSPAEIEKRLSRIL